MVIGDRIKYNFKLGKRYINVRFVQIKATVYAYSYGPGAMGLGVTKAEAVAALRSALVHGQRLARAMESRAFRAELLKRLYARDGK